MKIRKGGIFKTIDSKDFGIFQKQGWEKVVTEPLKKLEEVKPVKEKPIKEVVEEIKEIKEIKEIEEQPIREVEQEQEEEIVIPKSKRRK